MATNVGSDCDSNHYGQMCNKTCNCKFKHGNKNCKSGVFGNGYCILNNYGIDCSNYSKCFVVVETWPIYRHIGGICDCCVNGTGHCSSCYPRYEGLNCDNCQTQYYGKYCENTCSCKYGRNSSGINGTGHCLYCDNKMEWRRL